MAELDETDARRLRRRRIWRTAAYLGLLVAGILAAWQIHVFWVLRRQRAQGPLAIYEPDPVPTSQPGGKLHPRDLAARPMARMGLKFLTKDPGGPEPPRGATFRHAIERFQDGCQQWHLKYRYTGSSDAAAAHYTRTLRDRGLELLRDAPPKGKAEERILVFQSDREQITVQLGKRVPKTNRMSIGVMVLRLAQ